MYSGGKHIVSRFKWNTSLDQKDDATDLQRRLSAWSKIMLQRELAEVFDELCPDEQTWKINSLELDLGEIALDNLETDLALKIRSQLREKLIELILTAAATDNKIEILSSDGSHLDQLRFFLMNGVGGWNYKAADGTVNELMALQLQHNLTNTIAMIRQVGVTHENVRKRIAWQLSEPNLRKIIRGLEPDNYTQITEFSKELIHIQVKENLVHTGSLDFKKNLWLWILNHLLIERGTIFNKVAFMRSNIRQMADHYNMTYEELLKLIERAVDQVAENSSVKSTFFKIIKLLTEESLVESPVEAGKSVTEEEYWKLLETYFTDAGRCVSLHDRFEFNEFVVNLARQNPVRFRQLIARLASTPEKLVGSVASLNEKSLELVLTELAGTNAESYVACISFLSVLLKQADRLPDQKQLWQLGIIFFMEQSQSEISVKSFTDFAVSELATSLGLSKSEMLSDLLVAEVPGSVKSAQAVAYVDQLVSLQRKQIEQKIGTVYQADLYHILDQLIQSKTLGTSTEKSLKALVRDYLMYGPADALVILKQYRHKKRLEKIMGSFADDFPILELLKKSVVPHASLIVSFHQALSAFCKNTGASVPAMLLQHLLPAALKQLLFEPDLSSSQFLVKLVNVVVKRLPASMHENAQQIFSEVCIDAKIDGAGVLSANIKRINPTAKQKISESPFSIETVLKRMRGSGKRTELMHYLKCNFYHPLFIKFREKNQTESEKLLEYFLKGGKSLLAELVESALIEASLSKKKNQADQRIVLKEIFWTCLLRYDLHKGNQTVLRDLFLKSAAYRLGFSFTPAVTDKWSGNRVAGSAQKEKKTKADRNAVVLSDLVDQCLKEGPSFFESGKSPYRFSELVVLLLANKPVGLRRIIAEMPELDNELSALASVIPVDQLGEQLSCDAGLSLKQKIQSVLALHAFLAKIGLGHLTTELHLHFWTCIWLETRADGRPSVNLKELVKKVLNRIRMEDGITAVDLARLLEKNKNLLTSGLKEVLVELMPDIPLDSPAHTADPEWILKLDQAKLLGAFFETIVLTGELPSWFEQAENHTMTYWITSVVAAYPKLLSDTMRNANPDTIQVKRLHEHLGFEKLTHCITNSDRSRQASVEMLHKLYAAFSHISFSDISSSELQFILFRKLLKAWSVNNWRLVSTDRLITEILWDLPGISKRVKKNFLHDLHKHRYHLPAAIQVSLESLLEREQETSAVVTTPTVLKRASQDFKKQAATLEKRTGVAVKNAGLVLVSGYVSLLFERLGLLTDRKFTNNQAQMSAVHFLQHVATGLTRTEESLLPLNKVLCGLRQTDPVYDEIAITDQHKTMIEGLIRAIIGHWPAIGDCSVYGFRGNWLVRDGILFETDDKWELIVEKRAYDILIHKSPFSFSIINYPWMNKPLHVTWPY
ncbi:MAG: hypothetical protein HYZ14_07345 [Bacteroidetes bacterium]|nr:hypothetical protein [Bacteroidota bacterium]